MQQAKVDDWQCKRSLVDCNRYMLENEISCDVTFLVGENRKRMSAHKYILISRSSVFQAMFCGPLAETANEITIPDVPEKAFGLLLRYMYYEEADVTPEFALSAFYVAKKYSVGKLEDLIVSWLKNSMTVESACAILDQAILYDALELEDRCLEFIDTHPIASFSSDGFTKLSRAGLKKILCRDSVAVDEKSMFEAALKWSRKECARQGLVPNVESLRHVLGDAIYLIRFPLLGDKYIARTVKELGILSMAEIAEVFLAKIEANSDEVGESENEEYNGREDVEEQKLSRRGGRRTGEKEVDETCLHFSYTPRSPMEKKAWRFHGVPTIGSYCNSDYLRKSCEEEYEQEDYEQEDYEQEDYEQEDYYENECGLGPYAHSVLFSCNKPIILLGVSLYPDPPDVAPRRQTVCVVKGNAVLEHTSTFLNSGVSPEPCRVMFSKGVPVEAGSTTELVAYATDTIDSNVTDLPWCLLKDTMVGSWGFTDTYECVIGTDGREKVKVDDYLFTFFESKRPINMSSLQRGQFPEIIFF